MVKENNLNFMKAKYLIIGLFLFSSSCGIFFNQAKPKEEAKKEPTVVVPSVSSSTSSSSNKVTQPVVLPPIIALPGFKKGDEVFIDGPLWYDGTADITEYSSKELMIKLNVSVPPISGGYGVKDGKVNLGFQITKDNNNFKIVIFDWNKNLKYTKNNVTLEKGKTDAGFFSTSKDFIKLIDNGKHFTFTINETGKVTLSSTSLPAAVDLIRKDLT